MSDTTITDIPSHDLPLESAEGARSTIWNRIALGGIMLVSVFLNFFQLGQNGFPNPFYGAGVRSMMDSLHNFFFVAYDPGAFVTLDKPPLGFWIQTISAKIFGFSAFSVLLPEALAGVLSVLLLYYLVRRHFGNVAALLATLALAISPISVLTNRNNTIDSLLVLTMLIGAWTVMRAAETGKLRWLLLCAVTIGLGFNIKMAEALLVVPAFGLLYLLASPRKIRTRIWHLALALVLMLALSFAWIVTVDAIPASQRPYVDSTQDNSEFSLAVGYNGIQRLLGNVFNRGGGGAANRDRTTTAQSTTGNNNASNTNAQTVQPPSGNGGTGGFPSGTGGTGGFPGGNGGTARGAGGTGGFPGGAGGNFDTGTAGVTRLFTETLGGQISWLLPLALLGILALAWQRRMRPQDDGQRRTRFQEDPHQQSMILWGTWLLTTAIFFSVAGFFHQYYLSVMAPALCAMFGIGVVVMWNDYRQSGWRGWLLPIALVLTAALQISFIVASPAWGMWLIPVIAIACALAVIALVVVRLFPRTTLRFSSTATTRSLQTITALSLAALLLTSAVWSVIPVIQNSASQLPTAGPASRGGFGGGNFGGGGGDTTSTSQTALIQYLEANQGNTKFLVAVPSSMSGDSLIIATNKPVMSLGGFGGSDPILTTSQLQTLISNGTVRFFLLGGGGFGGGGQFNINDLPQNIREAIEAGGGFGGGGATGGGGFGQNTSTTWVTQHCAKVPTSKWQSSSASTGNTGQGSGTLYDCAGSVK